MVMAMNLKQFMVRQEVVQLYRSILKTIRKIEKEEDRIYMKKWVKDDFRTHKFVTNDIEIKSRISYGKAVLKELKVSIEMSK